MSVCLLAPATSSPQAALQGGQGQGGGGRGGRGRGERCGGAWCRRIFPAPYRCSCLQIHRRPTRRSPSRPTSPRHSAPLRRRTRALHPRTSPLSPALHRPPPLRPVPASASASARLVEIAARGDPSPQGAGRTPQGAGRTPQGAGRTPQVEARHWTRRACPPLYLLLYLLIYRLRRR